MLAQKLRAYTAPVDNLGFGSQFLLLITSALKDLMSSSPSIAHSYTQFKSLKITALQLEGTTE